MNELTDVPKLSDYYPVAVIESVSIDEVFNLCNHDSPVVQADKSAWYLGSKVHLLVPEPPKPGTRESKALWAADSTPVVHTVLGQMPQLFGWYVSMCSNDILIVNGEDKGYYCLPFGWAQFDAFEFIECARIVATKIGEYDAHAEGARIFVNSKTFNP